MVTYSQEAFRDFLNTEGRPKHITVVLGNFDGVHRGHKELLRAASFQKKMSGGISVVWTFPRREDQTELVVSSEERLRLLEENGIDAVVLRDFDKVRGLSPEEFVKDILVDALSANVCICGFNYRFGCRASGDAEDLKNICRRYGIDVCVCDPVLDGDGLAVSSTRIRGLLAEGNVTAASRLLGRYYSLDLKVLHGHRIGRTIGVPTINQEMPKELVALKFGVYAGRTHIDGRIYPSVTNVGVRPTVSKETGDSEHVSVETHVIGYEGDLYGRSIKVEFCRFLRAEKKFSSVDELKAQVMHNIEEAKALFEGYDLEMEAESSEK